MNTVEPVVLDRLRWIDSQVRTPHNRLLLACVGPWQAVVTAETVEALAIHGGIDWARFIDSAIRHGMAQIASVYLTQPAVCPAIPHAIRVCLERMRSANNHRNKVMLNETGRITRALKSAGIQSLVLKGPALEATVYPERGLRNFADLDLLVDCDALVRANDVLTGLGYDATRPVAPQSLTHELTTRVDTDILSGTLAPEFIPGHAPDLVEEYCCRIVVELHRGLFRSPDGTQRSANLERIWKSARTFALSPDANAQTLDPESMLVHLAAHASDHVFRRLIFPVDATFVIAASAANGPGLDWNRVSEMASDYDLSEAVYHLLDLSCRVCGAAAPEGRLEPLRTISARAPNPIPVSSVLANGSAVGSEVHLWHILGARSIREGLACAWRMVAQPVETMREIYGVRSLPAVWFWYLVRPFHLTGRAARLLVRSAIGGRP